MRNNTMKRSDMHPQQRKIYKVLEEIGEERELLDSKIRSLQRDLVKIDKRRAELQSRFESWTQQSLIVTEHAVLRFLERANIVDCDKIKSIIASESVANYAAQFGDGEFPFDFAGEQFRACVKENKVITVLKGSKKREKS